MPVNTFNVSKRWFNRRQTGILRSRLQSSVKWSDVSSLETELDNRILSSGRYMIQSSICPCVWVGRFTDCAKLKILSRSRILDIYLSVGWSKWKLKSPNINRQPVMELQYSRNADSCSTNRELVSLFLGLGGEKVDRFFSNDNVA